MVIHEPVQLDVAYAREIEQLDQLEAELLAQLKERKRRPSTHDQAPSVGQLEERLIKIHGRKSTLRTSRDPQTALAGQADRTPERLG